MPKPSRIVSRILPLGLHFGGNNLRILWLACRAISASAELVFGDVTDEIIFASFSMQIILLSIWVFLATAHLQFIILIRTYVLCGRVT